MSIIIPELGVASVDKSVDYYVKLFEGKLLDSVPSDSGSLEWAEIEIFGSSLMFEEVNALAAEFNIEAKLLSSTGGCLVFRVPEIADAKSIYNKAMRDKLRIAMKWKESDYGTAEFALHDPDGNIIVIASKIKENKIG